MPLKITIQERNEDIMDFICETHEAAIDCKITPTSILTMHALEAYFDGDCMVILE